jgi:hypothetical protein
LPPNRLHGEALDDRGRRAFRLPFERVTQFVIHVSRVDHLRGVGAGRNGGFAFTKQTVFDGQAVDVLIAGSNQDWFDRRCPETEWSA